MTNKKKISTIYGDVEVETVTCDSCGNEVLKENATPFTMGEGVSVTKGVACEICYDEGPVEYPERSEESEKKWIDIPIWIVVLLAPIPVMFSLHPIGRLLLLVLIPMIILAIIAVVATDSVRVK